MPCVHGVHCRCDVGVIIHPDIFFLLHIYIYSLRIPKKMRRGWDASDRIQRLNDDVLPSALYILPDTDLDPLIDVFSFLSNSLSFFH